MRYSKLLIVAVGLAIFTFGCSSGSPTTQSTSTSTPDQVQATEVMESTPLVEEGYPAEGYPVEGYPIGSPATSTPFDYTQDEGYPVPEFTPDVESLPDELAIPTPQSSSGVITGQLLSPGPGGEPYYTTLYLADTISSDQEGYPPMVAFSEQDSPVADQDKMGYFVFVDVPPGLYALAVWSPITSTIIQEPDSPDYLLVEVEAGETTDLGIIGIP